MTIADIKLIEKLKQKKYRDTENKFLIEGIHLIEECLKSDLYKKNLEKIIVRNDFENETAIENIKKANHFADIEFLDESKFSKLTETVTSQGIIGIVSKPVTDFDTDKNNENLITVALENINDPGNLGTIIRSCHWFGVDEVIVSKNSADIYNSKVIRASQGSIFFINIKTETDIENELENYKKKDYEIMISDLKADKYLSETEFEKTKNYVIVFGSESNGVSEKISNNKSYEKFKIKGNSECESLNVGVAVGIVLNEFRK